MTIVIFHQQDCFMKILITTLFLFIFSISNAQRVSPIVVEHPPQTTIRGTVIIFTQFEGACKVDISLCNEQIRSYWNLESYFYYNTYEIESLLRNEYFNQLSKETIDEVKKTYQESLNRDFIALSNRKDLIELMGFKITDPGKSQPEFNRFLIKEPLNENEVKNLFLSTKSYDRNWY